MNEPTERTSVTLPVSLANRLVFEARRTGRSASAVVRDALTTYFAEAPDPELPAFVGVVSRGKRRGAMREELDGLADARAAAVTGEAPR